MFEQLRDASIKLRNKKESPLIYIPNVISVEPLNNLYEATEWLFNDALIDYKKTHKRIEKRRRKEGYSQKNFDAIDALGIRIGSRTQSYVNQLCLMEDLLVYEYDRMCKFLKEASSGKIKSNPKNEYADLVKRMEPIRRFRNKVVAHTAYTKPKINKRTGISEDNPETVVRSILNLFPRQGEVYLGNNFYSGFSKRQSQLPIITIYSWEEHAQKVLVDWKNLFLKKMLETHKQCPIQNKNYDIEIAYLQKARKLKMD